MQNESSDIIKIVIVDDHQVVIDGIKAMLSSSQQLDIIGQAHDGNEALDVVRILRPDVVLMDINMPGMDGIKCTSELSRLYPGSKVLMLSMIKERSMVKKALDAGANGYVLKNEGRDELIDAIVRVHRGQKYMSEDLTVSYTESYSVVGRPIISRREKQVLALIVQEYTAKGIAEKLFITQHTVDAHRKNLLMKLGVKNTAGLVREALKHQLVDE